MRIEQDLSASGRLPHGYVAEKSSPGASASGPEGTEEVSNFFTKIYVLQRSHCGIYEMLCCSPKTLPKILKPARHYSRSGEPGRQFGDLNAQRFMNHFPNIDKIASR
jgi:hypothetical protein